jgi:hypothetical protein
MAIEDSVFDRCFLSASAESFCQRLRISLGSPLSSCSSGSQENKTSQTGRQLTCAFVQHIAVNQCAHSSSCLVLSSHRAIVMHEKRRVNAKQKDNWRCISVMLVDRSFLHGMGHAKRMQRFFGATKLHPGRHSLVLRVIIRLSDQVRFVCSLLNPIST